MPLAGFRGNGSKSWTGRILLTLDLCNPESADLLCLYQPKPMPGQLFTCYFLEEGIFHTDIWQESLSQPSDFDSFHAKVLALLENAANFHTINEASTEQELICPLFELLGWHHFLPQQGCDHNEDNPDHLLFGDAESKARAVYRRPFRLNVVHHLYAGFSSGVPLPLRVDTRTTSILATSQQRGCPQHATKVWRTISLFFRRAFTKRGQQQR